MSKKGGIKPQWKAEVGGSQLPLPLPAIDPKLKALMETATVEVFVKGNIVWTGTIQDLKPFEEVWA